MQEWGPGLPHKAPTVGDVGAVGAVGAVGDVGAAFEGNQRCRRSPSRIVGRPA